ncbi:MAG: protein kinase domain-containing protein [Gemmatimonadales bacterium]
MTVDALRASLSDRYTIERELGAGGMATVYLAEDLKHHRKVAIKVLREDLAASLGAARFLREIEIAAQLQHPHILPLLDSGEADGFLYYVMPYVTGQSLRERIAREGELPIHEAVRLITQVVDALAVAHEHGVVHRDIKPDNVMLSGRHALVADFGVAKAVSESTGRNTITTLGVAVGTPTYMSPEQAAADPHIDHRSDIYAVGVMAYELLAGRPPFVGATPQQVLAAHVTEAPDPLIKRRPGISLALNNAIMKCLEKRPADRWQTAAELLQALEPLATPTGGVTPTDTQPVPAIRARRSRLLIPAAAVIVVLAVLAWLMLRPSAPAALALGQATRVTTDPGLEIQPSLSPDGKLVAYAAGTSARMRIFVRPIGGGRTIPLTDDSTSVQSMPAFSPDGGTVLYLSGGSVRLAPALGGPSRPLVPANVSVRTAAWSPDGQEIAFQRNDSLLAISLDGTALRAIGVMPQLHSCVWARTGGLIACVAGNPVWNAIGTMFANASASRIVVVRASGGPFVSVTDSTDANLSPAWAPDGHTLCYLSNREGPRDIYAVRIGSDGHPRGVPSRMTTGLNPQAISLSADGRRLAWALYTAQGNVWSLPIPLHPPVEMANPIQVTSGTQTIEGIRVSPDLKWLLYDSNISGSVNIYRVPIDGGEPQRLTTDAADDFQPAMSPDGRAIVFHTMRRGNRDVVVQPLDGGPRQVVAATAEEETNGVWSPDGMSLAYYSRNGPKLLISKRVDGRWQTGVPQPTPLQWPRWSPDGRTIIGVLSPDPLDNVGGEIAALDVATGKVRSLYAPRAGSDDPMALMPDYGPDGHTIYFKSIDALGRAAIWSLPAEGGTPRLLVRFDDLTRPSYRPEWSTDGKRFFFAINDRQSDIWVAEIARP